MREGKKVIIFSNLILQNQSQPNVLLWKQGGQNQLFKKPMRPKVQFSQN